MFAVGGMELVNCSDLTLAHQSGKVLSMPLEHLPFFGKGGSEPGVTPNTG